MGCLDGNCDGQICKPDLISPHMPPKRTGWKLVGWPDFVPELFQSKYGGNPVWNGNTHDQVIQQIVHVLKSNGVTIDNESLCRWANAQWCGADPSRCKKSGGYDGGLAGKKRFGLFDESMKWATPYWQIFNVALSGSNRAETEAYEIVSLHIEQGKVLLSGPVGCVKCAKHFASLLEEYPPGKIMTFRQARVWLWRIHNESRDSKKVVPYSEIAMIYGWEAIEPNELLRIIEEELRA